MAVPLLAIHDHDLSRELMRCAEAHGCSVFRKNQLLNFICGSTCKVWRGERGGKRRLVAPLALLTSSIAAFPSRGSCRARPSTADVLVARGTCFGSRARARRGRRYELRRRISQDCQRRWS